MSCNRHTVVCEPLSTQASPCVLSCSLSVRDGTQTAGEAPDHGSAGTWPSPRAPRGGWHRLPYRSGPAEGAGGPSLADPSSLRITAPKPGRRQGRPVPASGAAFTQQKLHTMSGRLSQAMFYLFKVNFSHRYLLGKKIKEEQFFPPFGKAPFFDSEAFCPEDS